MKKELNIQVLSDMVFHLTDHTLKGTEPEGNYEEMGAALPADGRRTPQKFCSGEAD